jgi:hypothetical protein
MALQVQAVAAAGEVPGAGPVAALTELLDDLAALVLQLDSHTYCARPLPEVSGSVGEHVRHCLDHVGAFLSRNRSELLSYDHRERGTEVESDPGAALRQLWRIKAALERSTHTSLDEPIHVKALLSASGEAVAAWSSFGRELAFVMSHTIHHQAMIAALLAVQGVGVDDRFGFAPSTPPRQ